MKYKDYVSIRGRHFFADSLKIATHKSKLQRIIVAVSRQNEAFALPPPESDQAGKHFVIFGRERA